MNTVSIILPVYNGARTILRALEGVSAQSYRDYEVIVVDDGSLDDSAAVVEAASCDNLILIRHPQNRGAAAARNTGIKAARGKWIAFLDSDDFWAPEKIERQVQLLDSSAPGVMACTCGFVLHERSSTTAVRNDFAPKVFRREILFGCSISPGTTLMVNREAFNSVGFFDEKMLRLEDWDWLIRFSERYDLTSIPEPLADIYLASTSMIDTSNRAEHVLEALQVIRKKHIPRINSFIRRQQLESSLLIERAGVMYRRNRTMRAIYLVIASFLCYPLRNTAFFRSLYRVSIRMLQGKSKQQENSHDER